MATLPLFRSEERKARGAFFTPEEIAAHLCGWAIRTSQDKILEPSCGEAAFLLHAGKRLRALGHVGTMRRHLFGVDVHEDSVDQANRILKTSGLGATLTVEDFFEREPSPVFDAVIGNPPYVRYQSFGGAMRIRALEAALKQGVRLNQLASSWAAFTVHAAAFLKPEGRLALVLPAELLAVSYASHIRRFLLERFATVRIIVFEELVFPGVLEDVVLLLAEGTGGASSFEVFQARDISSLIDIPLESWTDFSPSDGAKWTGALMPSDAFELYERLLVEHGFETLSEWGETSLGAVTGNNKYFTLDHSKISLLNLQPSDLIKISPPGTRHLRGLSLTTAGWSTLLQQGHACYLFCPTAEPSVGGREYIRDGEARGIQSTYKCGVRTPWWRPNAGSVPDLLFTYMNHECPRLIRNEVGVRILNSLYGVKLSFERRKIGIDFLPLATLNSVTLLGAEIVGRAYGGGLLKFEPSEASSLPVPSLSALKKVGPKLKLLEPQIGALLRSNNLRKVVEIIDKVLLEGQFNMTKQEIQSIAEARQVLFGRRATRSRGSNAQH